jgi:predicted acetyltransferase
MAHEFAAHGDERYVSQCVDFAAYLRSSTAESMGEGIAPGRVPQSTFWLVDDGRVIGVCRLRHRLTPDLAWEGGHIGYDIRPSARRRGFGTELLALTLERAAAMGLDAVLVTCDADNIGSVRVIENNGGRLARELASKARDTTIRQYWIPTK